MTAWTRTVWPARVGHDAFGDARRALNDAVSIYFPDAALAGAFVARWCIGYKVETREEAFRTRDDGPAPRVAGLHRMR
jgi:hypothetical protein